MRRDLFVRPREKFGPAFIHKVISLHPGLSSTQIKELILGEYGIIKNTPEVHSVILVLRNNGKVKVSEKTGPRGGMTYEAVGISSA